jgi:hypothetical protein
MPDLDSLRRAMPSRLSDDLTADPFAGANRDFDLYRDPTGRQYVQPTGDLGLFEKDPGRAPTAILGGGQIQGVVELQDRRNLIKSLAGFGAKPAPLLVDAFAVYDAITKTTIVPATPDVMRLSAKDAGKAVSDYADQLARVGASGEAVKNLQKHAYQRIVRACQESLSEVLADPAIRAEFDEAAQDFTASYPIVRECRSIADAAALDDTGAAVAAWHLAGKAVDRLDAVVDLIAGFAAPAEHPAKYEMFRKRLGARRVLGISAAPADSADLFRALQAHGVDGMHAPKPRPGRTGAPWSLYGAQIDAGCTLSLPDDADALQARRDAYDEKAARQAVSVAAGLPTLITHIGPGMGLTINT